jgi:hypothetical protein
VSGVPLSVARTAACLSRRGQIFSAPLPPPGLYLPRQELALGRGRLAFLHAEADALRVSLYAVDEGGSR